MVRHRWFPYRSCLLLLVILLSGCSGGTADVSGKVTYNGAALNKAGGHIVFVASDNSQVQADIGLDGSYKAEGVKTGPNRVAVYYADPEHAVKRRLPEKGKTLPTAPFLTPLKYASHETSGVLIDVDRAGSSLNVDMKGPPLRSSP